MASAGGSTGGLKSGEYLLKPKPSITRQKGAKLKLKRPKKFFPKLKMGVPSPLQGVGFRGDGGSTLMSGGGRKKFS